ncbi:P2 phage tail completion R family protein [Burkholderia pseudomallei]|uniref:phage tail protein n=1 Tax=Burkholderia pseudomallei TaxID=28450 RepID=UPI00050FB4CA|nr:phage tail protein [Burkholderia pseudomallei]KGD57267.1 P2 phage tail completion R family protein [Burkholderia pseudomallei]
MNKPNSLRAALVAALPQLNASPDQLLVFVNEGRIEATGTRTASFDCEYECEIIIRDFIGSADDVMIAVVEWARANQPDLVTNRDARRDGITFVADVLSNNAVDLGIKLKLSESVVVGTDDDGNRTVEHIDDAADEWLA